jgi:hypothetical protein
MKILRQADAWDVPGNLYIVWIQRPVGQISECYPFDANECGPGRCQTRIFIALAASKTSYLRQPIFTKGDKIGPRPQQAGT